MADEITYAATAANVKKWEKVLYHNPAQTRSSGTDIGWLRKNDSRVNLIASVDQPDRENYYKVKALDGGKMALAIQADAELRVQVMDSNYRVIADSKENMGLASDNYLALRGGELEVKPGDYIVRVTRADGVPQKKVNFAMQMMVGDGTYKNDYLTREVAPKAEDRAQAAKAPQAITGSNPTTTLMQGFIDFNIFGV